MYERLTKVFSKQLFNYDFENIFEDGYSPDDMQKVNREYFAKDKQMKTVFNARDYYLEVLAQA